MQSGKTKFSIENATKTRIVLADTRVHILGSFQNIRAARLAPFLWIELALGVLLLGFSLGSTGPLCCWLRPCHSRLHPADL